MSLGWTWYQVTNALSGGFFIILGVLVLRLRSRERANAVFALFSIAFGSAFVLLDLLGSGSTWVAPRDTADTLSFLGFTLCIAVAVTALVWLGLVFPEPLRRDERSRFSFAGALAVAAFALVVPFVSEVPSHPTARAATLAEFAIHGAMLGMSALCALRFPGTRPSTRSPYTVVAGALVLYPAFYSGIVYGLGLSGRGPVLYGAPFIDAAALLGPPFIVALLWFRASARADPEGSRSARNVALLTLFALFGGSLAVSTATDAGDHWGYGAARTVGVVVLAYAIVRHQLLGIDVRVRWGLSRGTVAAAFVAAFFVASEGAQILFGAENEWFGLLAAGALVFAIAPLQRAAERLAERAVPGSGRSERPDEIAPRAHVAYRRALSIALKGEGLTAAEELELAHLAEDLGLGAGTALLLRREVEAELKGGGAA